MKFQLRPQETVLFEGDGTLLKSKINVKETEVNLGTKSAHA